MTIFMLPFVSSSTVELHFFGLIGTANHPDVQKIRIIGFLFKSRPHWQSEVEEKFYKPLL